MYELVRTEVDGLDRVVKLWSDIDDALKGFTHKELVLADLQASGWDVSAEDIEATVEFDEDGASGVNDLFFRLAKKYGYNAFKLNRAVAVVLPAKVIKRPYQYEQDEGFADKGVAVVVFSDPESGIADVDVVVITGYRFGVDDIMLDNRVLYTVHGDTRKHISYLTSRLESEVGMTEFRRVNETDEAYAERLRLAKSMRKKIQEVKDYLIRWSV